MTWKDDLIDNIVMDLLEADPQMPIKELFEHTVIIGTHNGVTENEIRERFKTPNKRDPNA